MKKRKLTPLILASSEGLREVISGLPDLSNVVEAAAELSTALTFQHTPTAKSLGASLSDGLSEGLSGAFHLLGRSRTALTALTNMVAPGLEVGLGLSRALGLNDVLNGALELSTALTVHQAPAAVGLGRGSGHRFSEGVGRALQVAALTTTRTVGLNGGRTLAALTSKITFGLNGSSADSGSKHHSNDGGSELHFMERKKW